jgi:hypothetical protein
MFVFGVLSMLLSLDVSSDVCLGDFNKLLQLGIAIGQRTLFMVVNDVAVDTNN